MKITNIEAYPVTDGFASHLFVVVDTDEGIYGVGESGLTGRAKSVIGAIEHFKPLLIGQDPFRIEHLWQCMYRGGFFPAKLILSSAASAIDIALWDIKGKALGVPVYELLGGLARDKVVCYPHNARRARPRHHSRWSSPACKPRSRAGSLCALASPRRARSWSRAGRCARRSSRCRPCARRWATRSRSALTCTPGWTCPTPCGSAARSSRSTPSLSRTRCAPRTPIRSRRCARARACPWRPASSSAASGSSAQLIEEEWIDYARIDLCIVGGITEAQKIAGWCETHYIKLALHNPLGPVSTRGLPAPEPGLRQLRRAGAAAQAGHRPAPTWFPVQLEWEDGYLLPPTRPGLGIEFDREAAKRTPCNPPGPAAWVCAAWMVALPTGKSAPNTREEVIAMNQTLETMWTRRSVRKYSPSPSRRSTCTSSWRRRGGRPRGQPAELAHDRGDRRRDAPTGGEACYQQVWMADAPVILCLVTLPGEGQVNGAIVLDHAILAATSLGYGTCWVGAYDATRSSRCWASRRITASSA